MKTFSIISSLFLTSLLQQVSASEDLYEYRFEVGEANQDIETFSLVLRKDITSFLQQHPVSAKIFHPRLEAYLDTSLFRWQSSQDDLTGLSIIPTITYPFKTIKGFTSYAELGFGVAAISDTQIGPRDLASAFHFKSNVTLGVRKKGINLFLKVEHFSNAGFAEPNFGLDILSLGVGFKF